MAQQHIVHGIDLGNYIFDFEKVLASKDAWGQYFKFLQQDFNSELLLFVQEVVELEQIAFPDREKEAVTQAVHIFSTYVEPTASQSLQRKHLKEVFYKHGQTEELAVWKLKPVFDAPNKAFANLKNAVLLELQSDSFPRFLRSKLWLEYLKSKDAKFIKTFGALKATTLYNYTDKDFGKDCVVTDADFLFGQFIAEDNYDWELLAHAKTNNGSHFSYFGVRNYMPNVSWFDTGNMVKLACTFPHNIEFCAEQLFSAQAIAEYDYNCHSIEEQQYFTNPELRVMNPNMIKSQTRDMATVHFNLQFPFPISQPRAHLARVGIEYFADKQQYIMVFKSYEAKNKLPKNWIEGHCLFFYILTKIDEERTLMYQLILFNFHGWATNKTLSKFSMKSRGKEVQGMLLKFLAKKAANPSVRTDSIAKCLQVLKAARKQQQVQPQQQQ